MRERFVELGISDQCRVLMQILNLFRHDRERAQISSCSAARRASAYCGRSKNLSVYAGHSLLLIHQSVTGVFEKQIDLLGDGF